MTITQLSLLALILLFLAYAIYVELIVPQRHGKTVLAVPLKRVHWLDGAIFVGLILLLSYQYVRQAGDQLTGLLLAFLIIVSCYLYFIRRPKILFKSAGFCFGLFYLDYQQLQKIELQPNGVLTVQLARKPLQLPLVNPQQDAPKIYQTLLGLDCFAES